jgi:hypothetical protein
VPIDSHFLTIFRSNGWIPNEEGNECPFLCQASIEGWSPKNKWGELNQVWSGLGQIFRDKSVGTVFLQMAFSKSEDPEHPFTYVDYQKLECIACIYKVINQSVLVYIILRQNLDGFMIRPMRLPHMLEMPKLPRSSKFRPRDNKFTEIFKVSRSNNK